MIMRKKGCKRFISILLSLMMIFSGLTLPTNIVHAAGELAPTGNCGANGDNVTWSYDSSNTTLTISGTGDMYFYNDIVSPFANHDEITTVIVEDGVTSIGYKAFVGCDGITSVSLPNSITQLDAYAFEGCTGLTKIEIPGSVKTIDNLAFNGCSKLSEVTISNGVQDIRISAFGNCSALTSISLPTSVNEIGINAFHDCTSLQRVEILGGVEKIEKDTFSGCSSLTDVVLPVSLTTIGNMSFSGCSSLAEVTLPSNVTTIEREAFNGCTGLESIDMKNVTTIGDHVFSGCTTLASVQLSDQLQTIESNTFRKCSKLTSINIPSGVTRILSEAFFEAGLTSIVIPANVNEIATSAFSTSSSLKKIVILNKELTPTTSSFDCDSNTTIVGYKGSPTETFASDKSCTFVAIDGTFFIDPMKDQPVTGDGSKIQPTIVVKDKNNKVIDEENYTVEYRNNTEVGTANVTVTGNAGTDYEYCFASTTFNIVPVTVDDVSFADVTEGYTNPEKKEIVINNNGDPKKDITGVSLESGTNSNFTISQEVGKYYIQPKSNLVANDNGDSKTYSDTIKVSYADGFATADVSIKVNPIESNVTVTGGTTAETSYARGKTVTIKANDPADGYAFDQWVVTSGGVTLNNENNAKTTFTMGGIPVEVKATYKDIQAPTITIKEGTNDINNFVNDITFGLFFKNTKEISIEYSDNVSVATKQYYIADKKLTDKEISNITWKDYSAPISITPNSKQVIYAKAVDDSGNTQIVNSNGIVVYTDSAQNTASIEYIKNVTNTLDATVTLNGNKINKIKNGDTPLSSEDYSVDGNKITFHKSFLSKLPDGDTTLTISYSPMDEEYQDITGNDKPNDTTITVSVRNPKTYVITYEQNGGTGDMTDGEATEGTAFTMPECTITAPTGYTFKTWAIGSKDSKTTVDAGKTYTFKEATKVYPIWEADKYKVTSGSNQKITEGDQKDLAFTIDAPSDQLDKVYVNDKELTSSQYSTASENTVIILNKDYVSTLKAGAYTLKVTFKNGTNVTTAITVNSMDSTTATTKPTKVAITKAKVSKIKSTTYTGCKKKPSVTVKYNGKKLKKGTDYTVSYKNNTKVGTAKVIIKGKGNYTGTKTVTFKIKKRTKVAKGIYKVNATGLYGHKSPHKASPINMYFKKGDKVTVTKIGKKVGKYTWVKVKKNKKTSYVYSKYLKL